MKEESPRTKRFTLAVTIQTIFLFIGLLFAGLLTGNSYLSSRQAALEAGQALLSKSCDNVIRELQLISVKPLQIAEALSNLKDTAQKPDALNHPLLKLLNKALDNNDTLYAIYLGWDDGDFYYVSRIRDNEGFRDEFKAPKEAERIVYSITNKNGRRVRTTAYYNLAGYEVRERQVVDTTYDPRQRPWFDMAKSNKGFPVRTPTYVFATQKILGTTFAHTFDGPTEGVIGIDISLDTLAQFLAESTPGVDGDIVVFNDEGHAFFFEHRDKAKLLSQYSGKTGKYSFTTIESLEDKTLIAFFQKYREQPPIPGEPYTFDVGNKSYMADIKSFFFNTTELIVAVIATENHFTEDIRQIGIRNLFISALLMLFTTLAIILVSKKISLALNKLAVKTDEIKRFNLDTRIDTRSRIKEVSGLAESIQSMKSGIESFTQYIPRDLVKRYIASNVTPEIGGDRRVLTILFTDIAGFTTLSEKMLPETVISMLSDYFSRMGKVVTANGGTIDKYIGDALMAFWNAPEENTDHTLAGCEAALRCARAVRDYAFDTPDGCLQQLKTRFGLHRGEAVVGNMGSSDRLNYTALGATVNMASRLEGLNKHYGTTILASEEIKKQAEDHFAFRSVDKVLPKGARTPMVIYELVGSLRGDSLHDLAITTEQAEFLERWEQAYQTFHDQHWDEATILLEEIADSADPLVALYLERARTYKEDPPETDWNGVTVMKGK